MMYCEFLERTQYGETYITGSMYRKYIEPAYMAAPDSISKDIFCKDFYKLHAAAVNDVVSGLITAKTTAEKCEYISGNAAPFADVEQTHETLRNIFLQAFMGIYKNYCRDHHRR